jgi:CRISPR/Cas system-associated endoribonuclease Cas2
MIVLITYDLNKPGKDYSDLYNAIKAISNDWLHQLTSVWLVQTELQPQQIYERLESCIDKNDELFIVRITSNWFGYLSQTALNWLGNRVSF